MGTMIDAGCRSSRRYRSSTRRRSGKLFFCCFNSRFFSSSSSSMNISSRSIILSPARHHRDHPLSLSTSLSRRLRSDGSLKGGQSPMFPNIQAPAASSKKRTAGALDNPEPSSPKVTCIGQVRVKSKNKNKNKNSNKHARKLRNPSRRRSGGDGSFRRTDTWGSVDLSSSSGPQSNNIPENRHRNQRWVLHLPLTICEGLKGLGAEISSLSSSCFSSSSSSSEKRERSIRSNLEEMEMEMEISSSREKKLEANNKLDSSEEEEEEQEDEGGVCVPPKNALLLMRCRSDPMRMAALSRRLLDSPPPSSNGDDVEREDAGDDVEREDAGDDVEREYAGDDGEREDADFEDPQPSEWCSQANANLITPLIGGDEFLEADSIIDIPEEEEDKSGMDEESEEEPQEEEEDRQRGSTMELEEEEEDIKRGSTMELEEEEEDIKRCSIMEEEEEEDIKKGSTMEEEEEEENEMNGGSLHASGNEEDEQVLIGDENKEEEGDSVSVHSDLAMEEEIVEEKATNDQSEEESEIHISGLWEEDDDPALPVLAPDCLLLMMGEPKVSMEVSKETWVCTTTDFMRFLPERRRPPNKSHAAHVDDEPEKKKKVDSKITNTRRPKPAAAELKQAQQPRRLSCSIPGKTAPVLTAQKLPRCKSEPMRTAAAKLVPSETCLWKSRKVVGVSSAAGVGF